MEEFGLLCQDEDLHILPNQNLFSTSLDHVHFSNYIAKAKKE
jgi:hypothetical protein